MEPTLPEFVNLQAVFPKPFIEQKIENQRAKERKGKHRDHGLLQKPG